MSTTPVNIPRDLFSEIETYCKANDKEVTPFIVKLLRAAFTIEKYGSKPNKPIIKEEIPKASSKARAKPKPKQIKITKEPVVEEPVIEKPVEQVIEPRKKYIS